MKTRNNIMILDTETVGTFGQPLIHDLGYVIVDKNFNVLRKEGFTFRLYHPGWVKSYMSGKKSSQGVFEPEETSIIAFRQFTEDRNYEDVLVLRDVNEELWAF